MRHFRRYNKNIKDAINKITEAFEILHGDIYGFSNSKNEQRLRENTRNIFENFHTKFFNKPGNKPGKIHILHLHGGLENKSPEQDTVFRTQANIIGYLPFGGYGIIQVDQQYKLYEKMCEDFNKDTIPVLAPPMDIRLEKTDKKPFTTSNGIKGFIISKLYNSDRTYT